MYDPQALRSALLSFDEAAAMDAPGGGTDAAVLVPLYTDADGSPVLVFTQRPADMRRHGGEISFPGGRREPGETLEQTALRESHEEIGLDPSGVEVLGALPPVGTFVTGYRVHPFVARIEPGLEWELEPREVDRLLELPVADLIAGFERKRLARQRIPIKLPTYTVDGDLIWGATARITELLLERLHPLL